MSFELVKQSWKFSCDQLKNNPGEWFILSLQSFGIVLLIILGFLALCVSVFGLYGFMAMVPRFLLYNPWYVQIFLALLVVIGIYQVLLYILSFNSIVVRNVLDAAQGNELRRFKNRVRVHALLWAPLIQSIIVGVGFCMLIIPGIYFLVRFAFTQNIVLDEQMDAFSALKKSWHMTRGKFFTALPSVGIAAILYGFPLTRIINMFFPFIDLFLSYAYVHLKDNDSHIN